MTIYLVGGAVLLVIAVYLYGRKSGKESRDAAKGKDNAKTTERVVEAREDAVTDKSSLSDRLRARNKR
jgi:hypothetical protein